MKERTNEPKLSSLMNTSRHEACQTHTGSAVGWRFSVIAALASVVVFPWFGVVASHAQSLTPAAAVPAWQQELDGLRLLEGSLLLSPPPNAAEAADRDQRLTQLYRQLADKYPDRAAVQKALGDYARRHDRSLEALAAYLRAQVLDPADADTADSIGSIELQMGKTRDASEQFQRAVNARPDSAQLHFNLGNVLYLFRHDIAATASASDNEAMLNRALAELHRAAELDPGNMQYAQGYAETFYMLTHPDWEQARTAWKAVLALSAPKTDFANIHLARISLRMKRPKEAEAYLALVRDPEFTLLKAKLHDQAAKLPAASPPSE